MIEDVTSERALEELRRLIGGEFSPGGRLPAERDLARRLRINRGTLRKALARLEHEGQITRHVGRGTFVSQSSTAPVEIAGAASPVELMDARITLEPAIAGEAALRARPDHLNRLEQYVVRGDEAEDYQSFEEWDVAFHRTIAEATQNPIFIMVMEVMRQMRGQEQWERLKRSSFSPGSCERYRAEHRAILQALERRDQRGAAAAMFGHMRSVRSIIFNGGVWEHDTSVKETSTLRSSA